MALSQDELEEMVEGRKPNPNAIFFEQAVLNVNKSKLLNQRIYDKKIYIKLSQPGVQDSISYEAQKEDFRIYKNEYEYFLKNKQGTREPGIEIIPNLDIAHLQELRDYGILTISKLAEMEFVPQHLEYAHRSAKIFNKALKESSDDRSEKETIKLESDSRITRIEDEERKSFDYDVLTTDRPEHRADVGQRTVSGGDRRDEVADSPRGDDAHRRSHGGKNWIDNWSISFKYP